MENSLYLLLIFYLFITAPIISFSAVSASGDLNFDWIQAPAMARPGRCEGSIAECEASDVEFDMDSEINRSIVETWSSRRRYISYGAMERDRVPCSKRGASYYNCRPGAPANPYNRGCSYITRCRS